MHLSWLDPHKMRKMTVVGREKMVVFDDMELERKVTVYEKAPWKRAESYGEWQTRSGDIYIPKIATDEPLQARVPGLPRARRAARATGARSREDGARVVRALEQADGARSRWLRSIRPRSCYPGTVLGEGVRVLENAVVGKQPTLGREVDREARAAAAGGDRRRHDRLDRRDRLRRRDDRRARASSATSRACASASTIADDVVVGRGSLVENDTTIGSGTRIQAEAYVTAYSTLEEDVFIAPCVVTTNDNFMGRTEQRKELMKGPTIRRGARVGGGAILCPGVEIGEEAFVGAGAVVTKDVPPRKRRRRQPGARPARRAGRRAAREPVAASTARAASSSSSVSVYGAEAGRRDLDLDVVPAAPRRGERARCCVAPGRRRLRGAQLPRALPVVDALRPGLPEHEARRCAPGQPAASFAVEPLAPAQRDAVDVDLVVVVVERRRDASRRLPQSVCACVPASSFVS